MKLPREWLETPFKKKATHKSITARKMTTARIDMSEEVAGQGLCPECKEEMQPVIANGVPCLCCMKCRIVLPQKSNAEKEE